MNTTDTRPGARPQTPLFPGGSGSLWEDGDGDHWVYCADGLLRLVRKGSSGVEVAATFGPFSPLRPQALAGQVCYACKTEPAVYFNYREQPFCRPCADGAEDGFPAPTLLGDLAQVLNRHGADTDTATPDHVLARYLIECLNSFGTAVRSRDTLLARQTPAEPR